MQDKDDGTHAMLPVAAHFKCEPDHAGLPVMWLRHSHGKLRRDAIRAAEVQQDVAVVERGRLHGASGLAAIEEPRGVTRIRGPCRKRERNGEWVRASQRHDRLSSLRGFWPGRRLHIVVEPGYRALFF